MVMTDQVADMLTRIRNAYMARKSEVDVPYTEFKKEIVRVLKEEGYIKDFKFVKRTPQSILRIYLKYDERGKPVIQGLKRVSKPGRRIYSGVKKLPKVMGGYGVAIISTPKGVMPDWKAREERVGGEIVCYVW